MPPFMIVDGAIVFREACKLGCEGIVSKRLGSAYGSGRSANWIKVKNPRQALAEARSGGLSVEHVRKLLRRDHHGVMPGLDLGDLPSCRLDPVAARLERLVDRIGADDVERR